MEGKGKTAIICIGGGMRSAHGAGFLYALAKYLDITNPGILIGSSGNAGNALYYATQEVQQYEYMRNIWTEFLSTPKFIFFPRFWRVMNIDYLIDTVFKHQAPMDIPALARSPISYFIPVTNVVSGRTRYVGKEDSVDTFELLRAAKAMPFFYRKKVSLPWGRYIDGELGPTLIDHVSQALRLGAKRIIIIDNESPKTRASNLSLVIYAHLVSQGLGAAIRRDISEEAVCVIAQDTTILCVRPQIKISSLTRSKEKLTETFESGVSDALALRHELRTLLT